KSTARAIAAPFLLPATPVRQYAAHVSARSPLRLMLAAMLVPHGARLAADSALALPLRAIVPGLGEHRYELRQVALAPSGSRHEHAIAARLRAAPELQPVVLVPHVVRARAEFGELVFAVREIVFVLRIASGEVEKLSDRSRAHVPSLGRVARVGRRGYHSPAHPGSVPLSACGCSGAAGGAAGESSRQR